MRVKMSKQPPPAPTASAVGPCPTVIQSVGRPGTGSIPSTIAPPDLPLLNMKVYCELSIESPHRGDSNGYTQYTFQYKNKITYPTSAALRCFSKGLNDEFATAVVNVPSRFEPLKFYYTKFPYRRLFGYGEDF